MYYLVRFLMFLLRREYFEIGRPGKGKYLTRWSLWGKRSSGDFRVFLHCFHRGDAEPYQHDHPWGFRSLILAGGYWEITPSGKKWYGPGSLLTRPASWKHRVELSKGAKCWTLIFCGPRERSWGFWPPCANGEEKFIPWREHQSRQDAGVSVCGDE